MMTLVTKTIRAKEMSEYKTFAIKKWETNFDEDLI